MKRKILILCTGNSARIQMAEGLFRHDGGDRFEVFSAGVKPSSVRPEAIAVMNEIGIDISGQRSKSIDEFLDLPLDIIVTVCDNARETCPVFPAKVAFLHWPFEDPAHAEGTEEERKAAFRRVRDQIRARFRAYLGEIDSPTQTARDAT